MGSEARITDVSSIEQRRESQKNIPNLIFIVIILLLMRHLKIGTKIVSMSDMVTSNIQDATRLEKSNGREIGARWRRDKGDVGIDKISEM